MNKKRAEFIYKLIGQITDHKAKKVSPQSKYAGQIYYDLTVSLEKPYSHIRTIQVFADKLKNPLIWTTLQLQKKLTSKYLLYCRNSRGYYYLVDWEEFKNGK